MLPLASDLRNKLERVVIEARDAAEAGAHAALEALAVHHYEPYPHMGPEHRKLRNHLRARARQLGDRQDASGRLAIDHLTAECAYEHWHRMLFARFLAENDLLIEPVEGMAISLAEAEELAREEGLDVWVFASTCAERMLPQIFRPDDPLLQISFATEHMLKLERLLTSLSAETFVASDALGWVYQFWQSKRKDEVNRSEVKIGADEIAAVTQLFTEPYMVEFLIHNTLGAWWAGKKLTAEDKESAETEDELRAKLALPGVTWDYLRFVRASPSPSTGEGRGEGDGPWRPAAGTFDGWPGTTKEIKVLDPCCGSGHFLVALLRHLVPIRMVEEGLSAGDAVDAVFRDNIHGLEIDERCCQIAALALALAAWTYPDAGGYRLLPDLHIACTGIGPQATEDQWLKLIEESGMPASMDERTRITNGLRNLYRLFSQAPTLGSLINPSGLSADLLAADYETIQPYLTAILNAEKVDDATRERAVVAAGMVKAADLLAGEYTLVITNVPYLGRGKQEDTLKNHLESRFRDGKADLATAFVVRCMDLCATAGTSAIVTPQNWLFLTTYRSLREALLRRCEWDLVARLGPGAFEGISGHVVNVALSLLTRRKPCPAHAMGGIDASIVATPKDKADVLRGATGKPITFVSQEEQLSHPDAVILLEPRSVKTSLSEYADSIQGIITGDFDHFGRKVWEVAFPSKRWALQQSTVEKTICYGGREGAILWDGGIGELSRSDRARVQGLSAFGRDGVAIRQMGVLAATLSSGDLHDNNVAAVIPKNRRHLPAIWSYLTADDFVEVARSVDQKLNITNATFGKLPFELEYWQKIAAEKYPDGLPEPESDDPTQWLFHGRPEESTAPLQVAMARLLGYRWPAELDDAMRLSSRARTLVKRSQELRRFADEGGIVCIPSVRGEEPAAERLLKVLAACDINPDIDLDDWLRNSFFEEHCKLFHDRPFVWHIWDGRKRDGFHALVNYHRLCEGSGKGRRLLENLTYAYLGEWITRQKDGVKRGEGGAEARLEAALELQKRLEAILSGEPPFDIFVRWKALSEQPIGWEPDINDGVRLNIRPFLVSDLPGGRTGAGILRYKPNIKWTKDRGKEPQRPKADYPWFWGWDEKTEDFMGGTKFDGNRWNDCHYTNKAKQTARQETKA